jgi:cobalt-zinc-cadmium efflux system outer membrane protein
MAAANAELIEASAALDNERRRIEAEIGAAQAALQQAGMALELAAQRQRLATDNDSLLGKAFELGEIDLATRLRTVAERHAADAELARARLESQRAVSRLNQALGVLP